MTAFDKLAERLRNFKRTGPNTGIASCPTEAHKHGDRSRGLTISAVEDRVLIRCHAGTCSAGDIVSALGLTLGDLFDKPLGHHFAPSKSRIPATDLLELVDFEVLVVGMIALEFKNSGQLADADWQRLATAAQRIGWARERAHGR